MKKNKKSPIPQSQTGSSCTSNLCPRRIVWPSLPQRCTHSVACHRSRYRCVLNPRRNTQSALFPNRVIRALTKHRRSSVFTKEVTPLRGLPDLLAAELVCVHDNYRHVVDFALGEDFIQLRRKTPVSVSAQPSVSYVPLTLRQISTYSPYNFVSSSSSIGRGIRAYAFFPYHSSSSE